MPETLPIEARQALYAYEKLTEAYEAEVGWVLADIKESNPYQAIQDLILNEGLTQRGGLCQPAVEIYEGHIVIPNRNRLLSHLPFGNIKVGIGNSDRWGVGENIYLDPNPQQPSGYDIRGTHPFQRIFKHPNLPDGQSEEGQRWEEVLLSGDSEWQMEVFDKLMSVDLDQLFLYKVGFWINIGWDTVRGMPTRREGYLTTRGFEDMLGTRLKTREDWKQGCRDFFEHWKQSEDAIETKEW